jgi:hypothetical protein
MGLFSKKQSAPVEHPAVERYVYVRSTADAVVAHLDEYTTLVPPRHSVAHRVEVATSGAWTAIRLPPTIHPWQLHNLAFWMLDCEGAGDDVIAWSGASLHHPAYRLVRDPEIPDAMCGWDDAGDGWTVLVPTNDLTRGGDVPVPRSLAVPGGFHGWRPVEVRFEDPGAAMNPSSAPTHSTRRDLATRPDPVSFTPGLL